MKISVIILVKNEEEVIVDCIKSVSWADEILVIDSGSTDKTVKLAKKLRAKIFHHEFKNFSDLRNYGLKRASSHWVLYIDADERVSKELAKEIKETVKNSSFSAYRIIRINYYFGKRWPYQDKLERLFQRDSLISWYGKIHESPKVKGKIGNLKFPLIHNAHRDLSQMFRKTIEWSKIEAMLRYKAKHPPVVWWRLFRVFFTGFYNFFIKQQGYKVGTVGLIESMYQGFSMFITYARLWELQRKIK